MARACSPDCAVDATDSAALEANRFNHARTPRTEAGRSCSHEQNRGAIRTVTSMAFPVSGRGRCRYNAAMRASGRYSRRAALALAFLVIAGAGPWVPAQDEEAPKPPEPLPSIAPHAPLEVGESKPRPAESYRRVDALVAELAKLDDWRDGVDQPAYGGVSPALNAAGSPTEDAFTALVKLGPEAIPALLTHLDDQTPTRLVCDYTNSGWGGMWCQTEIDANAAMPEELSAIREAFPGGWRDDPARPKDDDFSSEGPHILRHVVTIGDCCFAILGQIVNRGYHAVNGVPSCCCVVNSPTRDARIARAVRLQWEGKDPRLELARRLADDFHTALAGDDLSCGSDRQVGAALRLLSYFPEQSEALVVRLIDAVEAPGNADESRTAYDLLRQFDSCARPAIRAACLRLALRTDSPATLDRILDAIGPPADDALCDKMTRLLARTGGGGPGYHERVRFLRAIGRLWPDRYAKVLAEQLSGWTLDSEAQAVAEITYEDEVTLPVGVWRPLLAATARAVPWTSKGDSSLPSLRLCDVAAREIAHQRKDLPFDERADEEERDARIRKMRAILDAESK